MNNPGVGEEWEAIKKAFVDEAGKTQAAVDNESLAEQTTSNEDDMLTYVPAQADEKAASTIRKYQDHVITLVEQSVTIIVEIEDEKALSDLFRQCFLPSRRRALVAVPHPCLRSLPHARPAPMTVLSTTSRRQGSL